MPVIWEMSPLVMMVCVVFTSTALKLFFDDFAIIRFYYVLFFVGKLFLPFVQLIRTLEIGIYFYTCGALTLSMLF